MAKQRFQTSHWCCALVTVVSQGDLNGTIVLYLLDDAAPENKDEYKVSLSNIKTFGIFPHSPSWLPKVVKSATLTLV